MYSIRLLGGLRLLAGDKEITHFGTRRSASLLAFLAYHSDRMHSREVLMEWLWPEEETEVVRQRFKQELSRVRRLVASEEGTPPLIVTEGTNVGIHRAAVSTDVAEFRSLARQAAQTQDPALRSDLLLRALALYTGELLPGIYDDWVQTERERLLAQLGPLCCQAARDLQALGQFARALEVTQRALDADPLAEEGYQELMRLHLRQGQPAEALRIYQRLEERLQRDLEIPPSQTTRQLAEASAKQAALPAPPVETRDLLPSLTSVPPTPQAAEEGESTTETSSMSVAVRWERHLRPRSPSEQALSTLPFQALLVITLILAARFGPDRSAAPAPASPEATKQPLQSQPLVITSPLQTLTASGLNTPVNRNTPNLPMPAASSQKHARTIQTNTPPPLRARPPKPVLAALAPRYTVEAIGLLPDEVCSYGVSINDRNEVVGFSTRENETQHHAFCWEPLHGRQAMEQDPDTSTAYAINEAGMVIGGNAGQAVYWKPGENGHSLSLHTLSLTDAHGINAAGHVVGYSRRTQEPHAALWQETGEERDLQSAVSSTEPLFIQWSIAESINQWEQVVGGMQTRDGTRAFLWTEGEGMRSLGVLPGCSSSAAVAINDEGEVVGYSDTMAKREFPFLYTPDKGMHRLRLPQDGDGKALAINNRHEVVGYFGVKNDNHAFVWTPEQEGIDLNTLLPPNSGWILCEARGINNNGWIVGRGEYQGRMQAFVLKPLPALTSHTTP